MTAAGCTLTHPQQAAVARIVYALESPAAIALVCGAAGVGKTLVLDRVIASPALGGRPCVRRSMASDESSRDGQTARGDAILVLDDAHMAAGDDLHAVVEAWRRHEPRGGVVLAGEGRLLTLVARDSRLERVISLRAVLGPFTLAETREVIGPRLGIPGRDAVGTDIVRAIHEIAAGIPARMIRLAEFVRLVAEAAPDGRVTPDDVEAVHRRLTLQAA